MPLAPYYNSEKKYSSHLIASCDARGHKIVRRNFFFKKYVAGNWYLGLLATSNLGFCKLNRLIINFFYYECYAQVVNFSGKFVLNESNVLFSNICTFLLWGVHFLVLLTLRLLKFTLMPLRVPFAFDHLELNRIISIVDINLCFHVFFYRRI